MDVQLYMFINGAWQEYNPKPATHSHTWSEITGKPTTFNPSSHNHTWSSITGKPTTFTPSSHTHSISNITNLQSTLNGKANSSHTHSIANITNLQSTLNTKVDKVSGKGLSTNDYTSTEKTKLAGIEQGAEVNVQADWNETNSSSDAFIKNKPTMSLSGTTLNITL